MKKIVCAVYDEKSKIYDSHFFIFGFKGEAIRAFSEIATDSKTMIYKYPQDFSLYMLGTFDDTLGAFDSSKVPELVVRASDFKKDLTV
ncbi:MAG: nonstructural protein [Arizlama microvirus]|nr:MAG: nonstructural protein [Arizlama microvirus]